MSQNRYQYLWHQERFNRLHLRCRYQQSCKGRTRRRARRRELQRWQRKTIDRGDLQCTRETLRSGCSPAFIFVLSHRILMKVQGAYERDLQPETVRSCQRLSAGRSEGYRGSEWETDMGLVCSVHPCCHCVYALRHYAVIRSFGVRFL